MRFLSKDYEMTAAEEAWWTDQELDWESLIECAEEYWARGEEIAAPVLEDQFEE